MSKPPFERMAAVPLRKSASPHSAVRAWLAVVRIGCRARSCTGGCRHVGGLVVSARAWSRCRPTCYGFCPAAIISEDDLGKAYQVPVDFSTGPPISGTGVDAV